MLINIIIAVVLVVPCFFLWATIHEVSHYLAAKWLLGATLVKMRLIPHRENGRFYFASVRYQYQKQEVPPWKEFLISWAPRVPGWLACNLLLASLVLSGPLLIVWLMIFGSGAVDYANGLIGRNDNSDIIKAAEALNVGTWHLRFWSSPPLLIPLALIVYFFINL